MLMGPLSFVLGRRPAVFALAKAYLAQPLCVLIPATRSPWLWSYLRFSFLLGPTWMVELGAAELPALISSYPQGGRSRHLVWTLIEAAGRQRLLVLQLGNGGASSESHFRNARWLEREAADMVGVGFLQKRDRRTLFGLPVFYSSPLRKVFPTGGVFDLGLCPLTHKLTFRHISWLS